MNLVFGFAEVLLCLGGSGGDMTSKMLAAALMTTTSVAGSTACDYLLVGVTKSRPT